MRQHSFFLRPRVGSPSKVLASRLFFWPILSIVCATLFCTAAYAQGPTPGQNVNMVSGTKWPGGDPFLRQQNEPSIAVSTRNPQHLLAGANDYRTVDLNLVDQLPINQLDGDAWLGVFKSFDGGQRWQSTLLPGFPQDGSPFGAVSPMKGFAAGSDPVVRAGTNGMFYYSGIAFNRTTNIGGLFLARFIDLNNKENGDAAEHLSLTTDPIRYINTVEIDKGTAGQFIDKPWIAVDIPRSGAGTCTIQTTQASGFDSNGNPITTPVSQTFPGGNVYIAYAMFVGGQINIRSKINFSKSSDCGATWTKPVMISQTYDINQGTQVAVDPETGYVYVAWRVFSSGNDPNAIVVAKSTDGGNTFSKAVPVRSLPSYNSSTPTASAVFDQDTSGTEFRAQTMPTLAVGDSGQAGVAGTVYAAWSERGVGPGGDSRIMISASQDGINWSASVPVDNKPLTDSSGNQLNPTAMGHGHQLMPAMTFIGGKLVMVYYDLRLDGTTGVFTPTPSFVPDAHGDFFEEARQYVGDLLNTLLAPVFTPFVDDAALKVRRHTIDVVVAQLNPGATLPSCASAACFSTARLSRYDFGLPPLGDIPFSLGTSQLEQLKVNPPNLPMFAQGTVPFMGDYVDVAGQMFVTCTPISSTCPNGWTFNNPVPSNVTAAAAATKPAAGSPIYFGTWTTNQDVIPPADGVSWTTYTAPVPQGTMSVFNGQLLPTCSTGYEGDRNQNIYESRITQGLYVSSPQNSKPLSTTLQRAFVILVQNSTNFQRGFQLTIANQPPGGFASFTAGINNPSVPSVTPPSPVTTSVDVTIAAHSGATRTVFALSSNFSATITVNVSEIQVDVNGNPILDANGNAILVSGGLSSFIVLNADGTVPALVDPDSAPTNTTITGVEIYTPGITRPTITDPGITRPGITRQPVTTPGITRPGITRSDVTAPGITRPGVPNQALLTSVANTSLADSGIPASSPLADATYILTNNGNTSAAYTVNLTGTNVSVPLQLAVTQVYTTQSALNCALAPQQQDITNTNVVNPGITRPGITRPGITRPNPTDATVLLAPGDSALVTVRGQTDVNTMAAIVTQIAPLATAQAANTNDPTNTPATVAPLFITTAALPDAVFGNSYTATVQAIGGTSPYTAWNVVLGSLPGGLSLTLDPATGNGLISGTPTAVGTFTFTVQVTDSSTPAPQVITKQLSIRVAAPLVITTASPLPTATQGVSYGPVTFTVTGGTGSYSWTPVTIDGLSLTSNGTLNGIPTLTGTFTFAAQVTDSASPSQTASKSITLNVVPGTGGGGQGGGLFCNNFNPAGVTQSPNGPPNAATCTLSSTSKITQLATYHYNNGAGATPGTISLQQIGGQTFGPFTATGFAGQSGPNEAWVATPNVIVPAGTYTVIDSDPTTWSYNTGSNNAGFVQVGGSTVTVGTLSFVIQPTDTVAGVVIFPPVQVLATDSTGAVVPGVAISMAIGSNPGGGTLSGTLTQTTATAAGKCLKPCVPGAALFSDLSIDKAGSGYSLVASALSGTVTATSNSFSITAPVTTSSLAWTQLSPAGGPPIPRVEHSAVYNSATNRMTIFGGQRSDASVTNDVWVLSNANGSGGVATWTQLSPPGALPNARSSHSAVYSVAGDSMTIFGGFFGALNPLNDTWVLSNAGGLAGPVWTQLLPSSALPPARFDHSAVYDPGTNSMIVFGGVDGAIYNDVWVLSNANGSGGTPAWTLLNPSGGPPPARFSHTAVYDPTNNVMIVFGGATAGGTGFNDVWVLSNANGSGGASTWTQLVPGGGPPPPRYDHTAIYDPATNNMTVFGGCPSGGLNFCSGSSSFNDVWVLSNANGLGAIAPTWTQLSPSGAPPSVRSFHSAIYDPATNRMTVFGGGNGPSSPPVSALNDVWVLTDANVPPLVISSVNLSSATLTIGGSPVPYTAILSNGTGTTVSSVLVQAYINQGTASQPAGGSLVTCGQTLGDLAPGSCNFNFAVSASNSTAGTGILVPGPATARFELRGPNTLFSVFTVPVTLQ